MLDLQQCDCRVGHQVLITVEKLQLREGQLLGILGPNGAGKSSLLKMVSGDMPHHGHVELHGRELKLWPALERARHVGVLPQASALTFSFTAEEVVALGLTPLSLSRREGALQVRHFMKETDCDHLADRFYPSLSGGERQRVQLARVLLQISQASAAPLLLLDEPTSAQDIGQQHHVLGLAQSLARNKGYGVLTVLHDLNQVLRYCDYTALVYQGQVVARGQPEQILTQENIHRYWDYQATLLHSGNHPVIL